MFNFVLIFTCPDQPGIVSALSTWLYKLEANITAADQYSTCSTNGQFFIRIESCLPDKTKSIAQLKESIDPIASNFNAQYELIDPSIPLQMGILASGTSHCLAELLYRAKSKTLNVEIPLIISNHENHQALADSYNIPYYYIPAITEDRKEKEILELLHDKTDFLVLARYMQILSKSFLSAYSHPIINIHHSFLPSFKGQNPYQQAFDRGVKIIGATAHYVTEELDEGPVISQNIIHISHKDSVESMKQKGSHIEKLVLAEAVEQHADRRVLCYNHKTIIF